LLKVRPATRLQSYPLSFDRKIRGMFRDIASRKVYCLRLLRRPCHLLWLLRMRKLISCFTLVINQMSSVSTIKTNNRYRQWIRWLSPRFSYCKCCILTVFKLLSSLLCLSLLPRKSYCIVWTKLVFFSYLVGQSRLIFIQNKVVIHLN
jgi:hypothetical protein